MSSQAFIYLVTLTGNNRWGGLLPDWVNIFCPNYFPWFSHWFHFEFEYRLPVWHLTWCVMFPVTDLVPLRGRISRGRFHSLMSTLMKEVIVTTETKWQVTTHPNLLNSGFTELKGNLKWNRTEKFWRCQCEQTRVFLCFWSLKFDYMQIDSQ